MNLSRKFDQESASVVGFGVRTLLISAEGQAGNVARRLAGLGSILEYQEELYAGLDLVMDDPFGYGLIVIDCDGLGGLSVGVRAQSLLKVTERCIPVILISQECTEQIFPTSRHDPVKLRVPLSAVSLRVGFEHALRERLLVRQAG